MMYLITLQRVTQEIRPCVHGKQAVVGIQHRSVHLQMDGETMRSGVCKVVVALIASPSPNQSHRLPSLKDATW